MKFNFSDEQQEFRSMLRRFLEAKSPTSEVRRLMETEDGYDPEVWRQLAKDLSLTGIHIPEAQGGAGFGIGELAIACEEMGRALLCAPFLSSAVMAATAISKAATDAQHNDLLPALISGDAIGTLAIAGTNGQWTPEDVTATAEHSEGTQYKISGEASFVPDGHIADTIIVAARTPGAEDASGLALFVVKSDTSGLIRQPLAALDPTRKLAKLTFDQAEGELLGSGTNASVVLTQTIDIATICLSNEMVGGAERLFEDAIEYAKMRVQFGRSIASFQSLKHKAADMLLVLELAKSAAYYAAAAADEPGPDDNITVLASLAKVAASDAYMQIAVHATQIHGGIGFTWDNDTHLWFKRAKSSQVFLGQAHQHCERLMSAWDV